MRLGVTRSEASLLSLKGEADKHHVKLMPLPLQKVEHLPFDFQSDFQSNKPYWILFSSVAGVDSFFAQLKHDDVKIPDSTSFAVVGIKTAKALKSLNFSASFIPSESYGEIFFKEFIKQSKGSENIIYVRGEKVNFDPTEMFANQNFEFHSIISYRTISQNIDSKLIDCFTEEDYILYTAPSIVEAYQSQFGIPIARPIAIGRTTASTMFNLGWKKVVTMTKPDVDRVMEYIV